MHRLNHLLLGLLCGIGGVRRGLGRQKPICVILRSGGGDVRLRYSLRGPVPFAKTPHHVKKQHGGQQKQNDGQLFIAHMFQCGAPL